MQTHTETTHEMISYLCLKGIMVREVGSNAATTHYKAIYQGKEYTLQRNELVAMCREMRQNDAIDALVGALVRESVLGGWSVEIASDEDDLTAIVLRRINGEHEQVAHMYRERDGEWKFVDWQDAGRREVYC